MPDWLTVLAIVSLGLGGLCAIMIAADILAGHRQHMWIMNVVWPLTALYSGPIGLWAYYKLGRLSTEAKTRRAKDRGDEPPGQKSRFGRASGWAPRTAEVAARWEILSPNPLWA